MSLVRTEPAPRSLSIKNPAVAGFLEFCGSELRGMLLLPGAYLGAYRLRHTILREREIEGVGKWGLIFRDRRGVNVQSNRRLRMPHAAGDGGQVGTGPQKPGRHRVSGRVEVIMRHPGGFQQSDPTSVKLDPGERLSVVGENKLGRGILLAQDECKSLQGPTG